MSVNKFNTIHVKNLHILENETFVRKHGLHQLTDQNDRIASMIGFPTTILSGGGLGFLLSTAMVDPSIFNTLFLTLIGGLTGFLAGMIIGFILYHSLNKIRIPNDLYQAYSKTESTGYDTILKNELSVLRTVFVSSDNAFSYGYEYIDKNDSSSDALVLKVPAELKPADELKEQGPAMRNALDIYIEANQPTDVMLFSIVSGLMPTIKHREDKATQLLTEKFHKNTAPGEAFANQLKQESQRLQSEIESLESTLNDHLKENQSIIERTR